MTTLFQEGGIFVMTILTILLVILILVAFTAGRRRCKEIGLMALVVSLINASIGFISAAGAIIAAGDISYTLVWGGIRCSLISITYGLIIYLISLFIRLLRLK